MVEIRYPGYYLSRFKIPAALAGKMDNWQRDFLKGGESKGKNKVHLVNWEKVSQT